MNLPSHVLSTAAGLGAGVIHILSGPDHLAAVSPFALARGRGAWRFGVRWGAGHAVGALLLTGVALALREQIDLRWVYRWSGPLTGAMLLAIGAWGLRRAFTARVQVHAHAADGLLHVHGTPQPADEAAAAAPPGPAPVSARSERALLGVSVLHGVTGGSHLWAAIPALAMPMSGAIGYLVGFALGTVGATGVFAAVLGTSLQLFPERAGRAHRRLMIGASIAAMLAGLWWVGTGVF